MSWTNSFLLQLVKSLRFRPEIESHHNNILDCKHKYDSCKRLRSGLLESVEVALYKTDLRELLTMIFGDNCNIGLGNEAQLVSCFDQLIDFKEDVINCDSNIDVIDKMIIDELIVRIEERIEQIRSAKDYNPEA